MKKPLFLTTVLALLILLTTSAVFADETDDDVDYPWQEHAAPFDFMFNNMIDTHQQTRESANGVLHGFIYIHIIDVAEDGIPIAEKANCAAYPDECVIGWVVKGIPYSATLVNKGPRIWQIEPADLPQEPGYTHFHWLGNPLKPHGLVMNTKVYNGYLLKRVAATTFYWLGGNGQGGSGGDGGSGGCGGGCSGEDHTGEEGGCSGGGGDMGGGDMGGGDMGGGDMGDGCSGEDHTGEDGGCSGGGGDMGGGETGGCSGEDHTGEEGGCSGGGGDMGGGNPGHGGRLVIEGLDSHSNITTNWDGTWQGGGCDD